jgi:predicted nuclease of predicted toxin-antitoxin system
VKLLFDQNLSHKLVRRLSDLFPDSSHVREIGLKEADDPSVWEYAKKAFYEDEQAVFLIVP